MAGERKDTWAAGKLYEPYVGRWSRLVARDFLAWLEPRAQLDWLDVGCGTGALTEVILHQAQPRTVRRGRFVRLCRSCKDTYQRPESDV